VAGRSHARRHGFCDSSGQAIAYIHSCDNATEALQAKMLTEDEARRVAVNIARLPERPGKADRD
jgi:hypothetical protein